MSNKKKIVVMMGGESHEHDISLMSGAAVVKNLDGEKYDAAEVVVGRDGKFVFKTGEKRSEPLSLAGMVKTIENFAPDCVFIAMHGVYGEDGRMQALFDLMHVPYVGADIFGSAVAMDKIFAKSVYAANGLKTPAAVVISSDEYERDPEGEIKKIPLFPAVMKSPKLGSSYGVEIVREKGEVACALEELFKIEKRVLVEEYIKGIELTCPVVNNPGPIALPVIEIVPKKHEFFSLEAKYDPEVTDEICPARIDESLRKLAQDYAVKAHEALCLKGLSRSDFIWDGSRLYILETNTIPGLTEYSLLPKSAAVHGWSFSELLDVLIENA
ncbi:MAG: D-alanine--D-alanine ligase [Deltaproteobacteria bacterium]|nr:D-alanine--D-alanine ligase [Deltaproteobacteria bacterium]